MEKIISIDGKEVGFKATASTVLRYRQKFNKDLYKDIKKLIPAVNNGDIGFDELECFLRIAYIMAWQYDNKIDNNPNDWLDRFEMFSIYEIMPQIIELWGLDVEQLEEPKKKVEQQSGK